MPAKYIAISRDVAIQPRFGLGFFCEEMVCALRAAAEVAPDLNGDTMVVNSGCEGKHGDGSYHYADRAFDIQWAGNILGSIIPTVEVEQRLLANDWAHRIRQRLGRGWDIVVETTHIHVERDPLKGGMA